MLSYRPISVLHVEVGGSYGGSLRALELYLAHSRRNRLLHDVLFYYPTPGAERLRPLVRKLWTLYDALPTRFAKSSNEAVSRVRNALKAYPLNQLLKEGIRWIDIGRCWPKVLKIKRALSVGDYALVHVNNTFTYQVPTLIAAHVAGIPVVAHVRNPIREGAFSRMAARLADCVVTVSSTFEKELSTWSLPILVHTCHDGAAVHTIDESVSTSLRSSLLGSGNVLIGSVGRLEEQKGYRDLILAARCLVDSNPNVRFAIAGDGPLRPSLERLIAKLKLGGVFHLCGFKADVANFVAALDLFVSSSRWEGLPLAIVEAMLQGKPVIATDVGGTSEFVFSGRTGELVPPSDPNALTTALLHLLNEKELAVGMAREARQLAQAFANPSTNARALDEIIERTIRSHG